MLRAFQGSAPSTLPGPIGPAHWTLKNWVGVAIYLVLFAVAVYGIWRLARPVSGEEGEGSGKPPGR